MERRDRMGRVVQPCRRLARTVDAHAEALHISRVEPPFDEGNAFLRIGLWNEVRRNAARMAGVTL